MSKSMDALEHEVEATRGRLENTLASLQGRLNVASLAQDFVGTRDPVGVVNLTAQQLASTVRANPVPVLLIGAGLAFLFYDAVRRQAERRRLRLLADEARLYAPDAALRGNHPDQLDDKLDAALEETFPGSDPVSVRITK
jgi:hypothetical protein